MGLESHGGFGPEAMRRVPNMDGSLDASAYEKKPVAESLGKPFSREENHHYARMSTATSPEELEFAIKDFNDSSGKKNASEFGMSLDDMLIPEQVISLANGARVSVKREANGITAFAMVDGPQTFKGGSVQ